MRKTMVSASLTALFSLVLGMAVQAQNEPQTRPGQSDNQPPAAGAVQDPTSSRAQSSDAMESRTVRGSVSAVTTVGESMINYETNQAVAARTSYLTVLGRETPNRGDNPRLNRDRLRNQTDPAATRTNPADTDANATPADANAPTRVGGGLGGRGQADAGAGAMGNQDRQNLYMVAITPQTRVYELRRGMSSPTRTTPGSGTTPESATPGRTTPESATPGRTTPGDAAPDSTTPQTDPTQNQANRPGQGRMQNRMQASFNQLELGDRVEIQLSECKPIAVSDAKHGRNRIFQCVASSITILPSAASDRMTPDATAPESSNLDRGNSDTKSNDEAGSVSPRGADRIRKQAESTGEVPKTDPNP